MNNSYTFTEECCFGEDEDKILWLRKYLNEYLRIRPYFSQDFYPLTEISDRNDIWVASQFNRPEQKNGILQVFRRENSPYTTSQYRLFGIDENANYQFEDLDGGTFKLSGKEIISKGITINIAEARTAKIFIYKKV